MPQPSAQWCGSPCCEVEGSTGFQADVRVDCCGSDQVVVVEAEHGAHCNEQAPLEGTPNAIALQESLAGAHVEDQERLAGMHVEDQDSAAELHEEEVHEGTLDVPMEPSLPQFGAEMSTPFKSDVAEHLECAKQHGRRRLMLLRGPTLSLGIVSGVGGMLISRILSVPYSVLYCIFSALLVVGVPTTLLSIVPSDAWFVPRATLFIFCPACCYLAFSSARLASASLRDVQSEDNCSFVDRSVSCSFMAVLGITKAVEVVPAIPIVICLARSVWRRWSAGSILRLLWQIVGILNSMYAATALVRCIAGVAVGRIDIAVGSAILGVANTAVAYFCLQAHLINNTQSWLMSRGEASTAAAGVAELLGGQNIEDVLKLAYSSFRCISADKVSFEDMREKTPNAELSKLTQKARLGLVDAFVSHSWSDDPDAKWMHLQAWREEFKNNNAGKEPKLWIDKFCIDQKHIDESLACLPVYLAGCTKMLILCGKTYLQRLWCLVEIFVFLEMGGKLENLEVRLLESSTNERAPQTADMQTQEKSAKPRSSLMNAVTGFDARNARCFTDYDTVRLHGVIAASGHARISRLVSDIFVLK